VEYVWRLDLLIVMAAFGSFRNKQTKTPTEVRKNGQQTVDDWFTPPK